IHPPLDQPLLEDVPSSGGVLIVEGNYLLLQSDPWAQLHRHWTHSIFLNPGMDVLKERLIQRWVDHGLLVEAARQRALQNDIPNAETVLTLSIAPSLEVDLAQFRPV
ncbi:MAG: hypothetical protein AAFY73_15670, partial [Pseudomonadota bacterium]